MPLWGYGIDLCSLGQIFYLPIASFLVGFGRLCWTFLLPVAFCCLTKSEAKNRLSSCFFLPASLRGCCDLILRDYFPLDLEVFEPFGTFVTAIELEAALLPFPDPLMFDSIFSMLINLYFYFCVRSTDGMLGSKSLQEADAASGICIFFWLEPFPSLLFWNMWTWEKYLASWGGWFST